MWLGLCVHAGSLLEGRVPRTGLLSLEFIADFFKAGLISSLAEVHRQSFIVHPCRSMG
jgi:hypothetical protein